MKITSVILALHLLCSFADEVTSADCEQSHLQSIFGLAMFYSSIVRVSFAQSHVGWDRSDSFPKPCLWNQHPLTVCESCVYGPEPAAPAPHVGGLQQGSSQTNLPRHPQHPVQNRSWNWCLARCNYPQKHHLSVEDPFFFLFVHTVSNIFCLLPGQMVQTQWRKTTWVFSCDFVTPFWQNVDS